MMDRTHERDRLAQIRPGRAARHLDLIVDLDLIGDDVPTGLENALALCESIRARQGGAACMAARRGVVSGWTHDPSVDPFDFGGAALAAWVGAYELSASSLSMVLEHRGTT